MKVLTKKPYGFPHPNLNTQWSPWQTFTLWTQTSQALPFLKSLCFTFYPKTFSLFLIYSFGYKFFPPTPLPLPTPPTPQLPLTPWPLTPPHLVPSCPLMTGWSTPNYQSTTDGGALIPLPWPPNVQPSLPQWCSTKHQWPWVPWQLGYPTWVKTHPSCHPPLLRGMLHLWGSRGKLW